MTKAEAIRLAKKGLSIALLGGVVFPVVIMTLYFAGLQVTGNFHVVTEGALYRSAQPSEAALRRYAADLGIKTVVNLRHAHEAADDWEAKVAHDLGLAYFQSPLPSRRLLSASEIMDTLAILARAPKPVLIHSHFGSDRAGLISALYLMRQEGKSVQESANQLSARYGHYPYLGNSTQAMDETFQAVARIADMPGEIRR